MKVFLFTIVLTSSLVWSQAAKDPGLSKHASVGRRNGDSIVAAPAPKTDSLATRLAKIESQGAHVPSSAATSHPASAKPVLPKEPTTQNKNRPMKFTSKAPARSGQVH